jgi:diguanylate cyclase (GGDEF)-like protein
MERLPTARSADPAVPVAQPGWRAARWCFAALAVLLVGFAASTLLRPSGRHLPLLDDVGVNVIELGAGLLCLARGFLPGGHRLASSALGAAIVLFGLGNVAFSLQADGGAPPVPSLADPFYLAFYPLAYLAVVLLLRATAPGFLSSMWLDGLIAGLGVAAVGAALAIEPVLGATGGPVAAVVVNLAYPVGDLILLALAAGALSLLPRRWDPRWFTLLLGCLLFAVVDTGYLIQVAAGTFREGTPLHAGWPAALLLMSWTMWQRPGPRAVLRLDGAVLLVMPGVAALAGLGILVYGNLHGINRGALGLAAATMVATAARMALSLRDLRALAESRRLALTDELTGLGNRRLLASHLDRLLAGGGAEPRRLALLLIDLNRFKEINDSFGHPVGDELLRQLGPRLSGVLRRADTLVRLGGDEFAVVLDDADTEYASLAAERLTAELERPFPLDAVSLHISASIGIARHPVDAADADGLLRCADVAMYRAKAARYSFTVYDGARDHSRGRLRVAEELRVAIRSRELVLHYQPQMDLRRGGVPSVEALLRWPHAEHGSIPPDTFIPLAEETGLMRGLTTLVLESALAQCARWHRAGQPVAVAVNLSTTNLLDTELVRQVSGLLAEHRLPAGALILEITESTLLADTTRAQHVVRQLRELGTTVSIDDFGTGFSSLAYLRDLAVGELKLDRAFIGGLDADHSGHDTAIVHSAIDLAHALGLRIVAEGVENAGTLARLTDLGCDMAQGFHISRPLPADRLDLTAYSRIGQG